MREHQILKRPGASRIATNGKVCHIRPGILSQGYILILMKCNLLVQQHTFLVEDEKHPDYMKVREFATKIHDKMIQKGWKPDLSCKLLYLLKKENSIIIDVTNGQTDEEKESHLCWHSERLALAYGLMNIPEGPIRIIKNLRVCPDCHQATKFISKMEEREIHVRDASRWHHFQDGKCSCGDFF